MKKYNLIIGITGTLGAGKGAIVEILQKEYGFTHFSVRSFLSSILRRQGAEVNRDSLTELANKLRSEYGGDYIIKQMFNDAYVHDTPVVIESIRSKTEVDYLIEQNIPLISIDAPRELRYDRIVSRALETDHVSYEEFCANENREMYNDDPLKQNLVYAMSKANIAIKNDGTLEELEKEVAQVINLINQSQAV